MNYYTCPICGFDRMTDAPEDLNICPCCGTEFGNDTYYNSADDLRQLWLVRGARWFSTYIKPPKNWNATRQLISANLRGSFVVRVGKVTHTEATTVNVTDHASVIPIGVAA